MFANGNKETLCLALTQSKFDYSVSSYYPAMSQMAKKKLEVVQNKLIRFMLNLGPRDYVGIQRNTLGLLNFDDRAKQIRLIPALENILEHRWRGRKVKDTEKVTVSECFLFKSAQ